MVYIVIQKFEYIENDKLQPSIVINGSKEDHIAAVAESVEHLLNEEAPADCIIDYINVSNFLSCLIIKNHKLYIYFFRETLLILINSLSEVWQLSYVILRFHTGKIVTNWM